MKYLVLIVIFLPLIFGAPKEQPLRRVRRSVQEKVLTIVKDLVTDGMAKAECKRFCIDQVAEQFSVNAFFSSSACGAACKTALAELAEFGSAKLAKLGS